MTSVVPIRDDLEFTALEEKTGVGTGSDVQEPSGTEPTETKHTWVLPRAFEDSIDDAVENTFSEEDSDDDTGPRSGVSSDGEGQGRYVKGASVDGVSGSTSTSSTGRGDGPEGDEPSSEFGEEGDELPRDQPEREGVPQFHRLGDKHRVMRKTSSRRNPNNHSSLIHVRQVCRAAGTRCSGETCPIERGKVVNRSWCSGAPGERRQSTKDRGERAGECVRVPGGGKFARGGEGWAEEWAEEWANSGRELCAGWGVARGGPGWCMWNLQVPGRDGARVVPPDCGQRCTCDETARNR